MVQSIDPAMTSLTKNGGRSIQHFCCWLLPGGDPICMLYVCQPASSHVEMCRISWLSISYHVLFYWLRTRWSGSPYIFPASLISTRMSWRECCVGKVMWIHHLVRRCGCICDQWAVFHSILRQIFPGRPCLGGQGYSCPVYLLRRYQVATR